MTHDFRSRPVSERHVQALWYDAALRPAELRTARGAAVTVIDPGRWNVEAGPDFRDAVLIIDGVRRTGDVEIHLRGSDWSAHGHAANPDYARVIAHVTWYPVPSGGGAAADLPRGCVRICLGDFVRTRNDFSPDEIDLAAYPYARLPGTPRPCETVFARDTDGALALMRAGGVRRVELKARRLKTLFVRHGDRAQTFYEEMMAAFGYKQNAAAFRALARAVPWNELPCDPGQAETVLSCAAGLAVAREQPWKRANVRPSNSPARRLTCAARLFAPGVPRLLRRLAGCDLAAREGQREAVALLHGACAVGAARAAAMLVNVIVPFALAEARLEQVPDWLVPEDISAPVRLTAFRLLGRDHNPALYSGNGLLIQGLIQIHRDFCLAVHPDCSACPLAQSAGEGEERPGQRMEIVVPG